MSKTKSTSDYFIPGSILHIENYEFTDGQVRNKYLIVACPNSTNNGCLFSFTTTQIKVPEAFREHGCHKKVEAALGHYVFEENRVIGDNGFSFSKRTYVLFQGNFRTAPHVHFDVYNTDAAISSCCVLLKEEFSSLLNCYKNSIHVRGKDKPLIESMFATIQRLPIK